MIHKTIVIVGGGPVGLTMALELSQQRKRVVLIDQSFNKAVDERVLALSYASHNILNRLGAWVKDATPIDCVRISHAGLGVSNIRASQLDLDHLGYTVEYSILCAALIEQVRQNDLIELLESRVLKIHDGDALVTVEHTTDGVTHDIITAELVIMAEGGQLLSEEAKKISHDYAQQALIAHVKTAKQVQHMAYERFAKSGPLVLLPFKEHYVMVWSLPNGLAEQVKSDPDRLLSQLNLEFANRLGGAQLIGKISAFPLKLSQVKKRFRKRVVLIGNSAQTVHPVSAQGLNLGLRDVAMLGSLISQHPQFELGILANFDKARDRDANAVIGFTHFLATFLERQGHLLTHLRGMGLIALSNLPVVQNFIARSLIFGI